MKEKTEFLQDFSGGLNTFLDPNRIKPTELAAAENVYFDTGAMIKRRGATSTAMTINATGSASTVTFRGFKQYFARIGTTSTLAQQITMFIVGAGWSTGSSDWTKVGVKLWKNGSFSNVTYTTGTASTTSGSAVVTGSGTAWDTSVRAGDIFASNPDGNYISILTVDSATQVTLTSTYPSTNTGQAYTIIAQWPNPTAAAARDQKGRVRMVTINNKAYIFSSYDLAATNISWDGATMALVTAFPAVKYGLVYKNYVFGANTLANSSRLSWSSLKDPTTWPASNFIDISPDDGQEIRGLFLDGQSIVVLKRRSAYKVTGDIFDPSNPTYTVTPIYCPFDFGITTDKVVQLYRDQFFMKGDTGIFVYQGGNVIDKHPSSTKINSEWSNLATYPINVNDALFNEESSIVKDGRYWFMGIDNSNASAGEIIVLDEKDSVWKWDTLAETSNAPRWGDMIFNPDNSTYYGVDSVNAFLNVIDTGSTDGSAGTVQAIQGTATTKVFEYANQQHFGTAAVYFKKQNAGNLTFSYSIDEGTFTNVTIDMTTGTGTRVKSALITIGQVGYSIQFKVANSTVGQTFSLYGIEYQRRTLGV